MKKVYYGIILMGFLTASGINCIAQDNKAEVRQVMQASQEAVDAIAMYPRETRMIIFEACEYPELITKLNDLQKSSQGAFVTLISSLGKEEQEKIWNLTRYDGLITYLGANPKRSEAEINAILVNYPEEIHKPALEELKKRYDLLVRIDQMNRGFDSNFELLLNAYPPDAKNAFREMIKMPEVLDILFDNIQYTAIVGNFYKRNPERILHKTDSLNLVLTQKNTQEADDWKQSLNNDPDAQKEYVQAAQEYAQDNGYQPADYNTPMTAYDTNYNSNPYNWWFGYPTWYPDNSWNPYPYWYDWGFYFGPGKQVVFIGLPSSYFMDWYFYNPEHLAKYAELSNHCYDYYDRHRTSTNNNSISHSMNDWRTQNKDIVTDDWDVDKTNRVERFRQYGQMETNRRNYNIKNPKQQIERAEYIQKTPNKYYFLASDVSRKPTVERNTKTTVVERNVTEPVRRPTVAIPDRSRSTDQQPATANSQPVNNVTRQRTATASQPSRTSIPSRQVENAQQMRNAQQYQQNTWKQAEQPQQNRTPAPTRQPEVRQVVQPQPTRQSTPTPATNRR